MSQIPIPGPHGTSWLDSDPEPMTADEANAHDVFWENYDHQFTLLYQEKLSALGYPSTYKEAQVVYTNREKRHKIDSEYKDLESTNAMAEIVGNLEQLQRRLRG